MNKIDDCKSNKCGTETNIIDINGELVEVRGCLTCGKTEVVDTSKENKNNI